MNLPSRVEATIRLSDASHVDTDARTIFTSEAELLAQGSVHAWFEDGTEKLPVDVLATAALAIGEDNLQNYERAIKRYKNTPWLTPSQLSEQVDTFSIYHRLVQARHIAARALELQLLAGTPVDDDRIHEYLGASPQHRNFESRKASGMRTSILGKACNLDIKQLRHGVEHALRGNESVGDVLAREELKLFCGMGEYAVGQLAGFNASTYGISPDHLSLLQETIRSPEYDDADEIDVATVLSEYYGRHNRGDTVTRMKPLISFMRGQRAQDVKTLLPITDDSWYIYHPSNTHLYVDIPSLPKRGVQPAKRPSRQSRRSGNPAKRSGNGVSLRSVVSVVPSQPVAEQPAQPTVEETPDALPAHLNELAAQHARAMQVFAKRSAANLREIGLAGRNSFEYALMRTATDIDVERVVQVYAGLWELAGRGDDEDTDEPSRRLTEVLEQLEGIRTAYADYLKQHAVRSETAIPSLTLAITPEITWMRRNWHLVLDAASASEHRHVDLERLDKIATMLDVGEYDLPETEPDDEVRINHTNQIPTIIPSQGLERVVLPVQPGTPKPPRQLDEYLVHLQTGEASKVTIDDYLAKIFPNQSLRQEALRTSIASIAAMYDTPGGRGLGIKKLVHFRHRDSPVFRFKPSNAPGLGEEANISLIRGLRIFFTIGKDDARPGDIRIISVVDRSKMEDEIKKLR